MKRQAVAVCYYGLQAVTCLFIIGGVIRHWNG